MFEGTVGNAFQYCAVPVGAQEKLALAVQVLVFEIVIICFAVSEQVGLVLKPVTVRITV